MNATSPRARTQAPQGENTRFAPKEQASTRQTTRKSSIRYWRGRRVEYKRVNNRHWIGGHGYVWQQQVIVWRPGTPLEDDGLPAAAPGEELPAVMMSADEFDELTRTDREASKHINTSVLDRRIERLEEQLQELITATPGRQARTSARRRRQERTAKSAAHALHVEIARAGIDDHYDYAGGVLGRRVTSLAALTTDERNEVRQALDERAAMAIAY